jgi:hypothetical protein
MNVDTWGIKNQNTPGSGNTIYKNAISLSKKQKLKKKKSTS